MYMFIHTIVTVTNHFKNYYMPDSAIPFSWILRFEMSPFSGNECFQFEPNKGVGYRRRRLTVCTYVTRLLDLAFKCFSATNVTDWKMRRPSVHRVEKWKDRPHSPIPSQIDRNWLRTFWTVFLTPVPVGWTRLFMLSKCTFSFLVIKISHSSIEEKL